MHKHLHNGAFKILIIQSVFQSRVYSHTAKVTFCNSCISEPQTLHIEQHTAQNYSVHRTVLHKSST